MGMKARLAYVHATPSGLGALNSDALLDTLNRHQIVIVSAAVGVELENLRAEVGRYFGQYIPQQVFAEDIGALVKAGYIRYTYEYVDVEPLFETRQAPSPAVRRQYVQEIRTTNAGLLRLQAELNETHTTLYISMRQTLVLTVCQDWLPWREAQQLVEQATASMQHHNLKFEPAWIMDDIKKLERHQLLEVHRG